MADPKTDFEQLERKLSATHISSDSISSSASNNKPTAAPTLRSKEDLESAKIPSSATDRSNEYRYQDCYESHDLGDETINAYHKQTEYNDYDAPKEPWHPDSTGPVARQNFHRYQLLVEEQMRRLRMERDEFRALWNKEKARADSGIKRYRENKRMIEKQSKADDVKWEKSLRAKRNEPVWPRPEGDTRSHFLYDNVEDVMSQHCITTTLMHAAARLNDRKEPDEAEKLVLEALEVAKRFDYEPLEARCKYWLGRVELARGNDAKAKMYFLQARSCIGKYHEGQDVEVYLSLFQHGLTNLDRKLILLNHARAMFAEDQERRKKLEERKKRESKAEDPHVEEPSKANFTGRENKQDRTKEENETKAEDAQELKAKKHNAELPPQTHNKSPIRPPSIPGNPKTTIKTSPNVNVKTTNPSLSLIHSKKDIVKTAATPKWAIHHRRSPRVQTLKPQQAPLTIQQHPSFHLPHCPFTFVKPSTGLSPRARRTNIFTAQACEDLIPRDVWESVKVAACRMTVSLPWLEWERCDPVGTHQRLLEVLEDFMRRIKREGI